MKLLYSAASPYSAKVRMAAHYLGLPLEATLINAAESPPELTAINPLGKIPVLIREDLPPVFDSRAIMQFLDRESKGGLYPRRGEKRTESEVLEALCDGITDCLLAVIYEKRLRPEERQHQPWIDKQWEKVERSLDYLNANLPKTTKKLTSGHFALAALIGYLDLRFPGEWEKRRSKLKAWPAKFEKFLPAYGELKSR
jgi:glutathione S-transferase